MPVDEMMDAIEPDQADEDDDDEVEDDVDDGEVLEADVDDEKDAAEMHRVELAMAEIFTPLPANRSCTMVVVADAICGGVAVMPTSIG